MVTNGPKKFGGNNKVTILTKLFLRQENVWSFCQVAKKNGRNNEVTVRQGSTVFINQEIITVALSSLLWCKVKCSSQSAK